MELNEAEQLLEQFKEKCKNSNLRTILFVTDNENGLFVGSFYKKDIKKMLIAVLKELKQSDRVEIIKTVWKIFII